MDKKSLTAALSQNGRRPFITKTDIAEAFGKSRWTIDRYLAELKLDTIDIGSGFYDASEVAAALLKKVRR